MDYIVGRSFNTLYIWLDSIWLILFLGILIYRKKYTAITIGFIMGIVYFIVDYGIFYLALSTRVVNGADPFGLLFWLSMSYGFTNFTWIWLLLEKDGKSLEWSMLPIIGWFTVSLLSQNFGTSLPLIVISRQIRSYHGVMILILAIGYLFLIVQNLSASKPKFPIKRLLLIGFGVQFSWEFVLLLTGIRPEGFKPLIMNSLIETNLGMPYIYLIFLLYTRKKKSANDLNL